MKLFCQVAVTCLHNIYMEITLRVLEYRVLRQLENPSKYNKEKYLSAYEKYDNVLLVNFRRHDKEIDNIFPDKDE